MYTISQQLADISLESFNYINLTILVYISNYKNIGSQNRGIQALLTIKYIMVAQTETETYERQVVKNFISIFISSTLLHFWV